MQITSKPSHVSTTPVVESPVTSVNDAAPAAPPVPVDVTGTAAEQAQAGARGAAAFGSSALGQASGALSSNPEGEPTGLSTVSGAATAESPPIIEGEEDTGDYVPEPSYGSAPYGDSSYWNDAVSQAAGGEGKPVEGHGDLDAIANAISEAQDQIGNLNALLAELEAEKQKELQYQTECRKYIGTLMGKLATAEKHLAKAEDKLAGTIGKLRKRYKTKWVTRHDRARDQVKALKKEIDKWQTQLSRSEQRVAFIESKIRDTKSTIRSKEQRIGQLERKAEQVKAEIQKKEEAALAKAEEKARKEAEARQKELEQQQVAATAAGGGDFPSDPQPPPQDDGGGTWNPFA